LRGAASVVLRNGAICANIAVFAGFMAGDGGSSGSH
jgi:hypothetical protein